MKKNFELAIVIPAYNESKRLSLNKFLYFLKHHDQVLRCFVNDGSTDNTKILLQDSQLSSIDNVTVSGSPALVETNANTSQSHTVRQGNDVYFFTTENNNVIARIENASADLGCVSLNVTAEGTDIVNNSNAGVNRSSKVVQIEADGPNAATATYDITFFMTADELANFSTPVTYFTDEQLQKENAMFDDYVKRHEMCHGFDPSIYEGLPDKYANANFDLVAPTGEVTSLRDSYKTYFKEQFADGCATLEYVLENDYESLKMMSDISQFRDSSALNNTSGYFQLAKTDAIREKVASDTKVASRMEKYFLGHDTGPTIRQISVLSERLQPTDKAILAADPQAFEQFVKEVIENSAYSPEEYMQIAHDSLAMSQNVDAPISDVTREFLGRGYDGRTHTIEYNLQLPEGSIRALQEAAPRAIQDQAREAVLLYADNMDNPTKTNMLNVPTEELSTMSLEGRLLFGSSYDLISGTDTWKGLHQLSPELKDMGTREVTPHMASFHFRNAGLVAQEAGDKLYEIADPEFDKDLYEMEQEALKGFEIKF